MKNSNQQKISDEDSLDLLTRSFFSIFNNKNTKQSDFSVIYDLCIAETIIVKKKGEDQIVYNLKEFIEPRKEILSDGTLTDFEETEIESGTKIIGNIGQRFSRYQKNGYLNGKHFQEYGNKFFQFIKTKNGWKINSVIWEDE